MNFFSTPGVPARRVRPTSPRRARRLTPVALESALESRLLMAAGPIGINLAGTLGYVDLMKETRPWTPLTSSTLATDANGWPLADAQIVVLDDRVNQSFNGPDPVAVQPNIGGTYHLSFNGQATITPDFANNFTVQNQVYNLQTNTTTADLVIPQNAYNLFLIDFRNTVNPASSTGAGVSNVRLIQPGYAANSTQLFTNAMLGDLAPFTTVRYLNIDQANSYAPTYDSNGNLVPLQWSQRRLPTAASQTSGPGQPGQSWEYMIALANATNTDMWINIPGPATDDYVRQLANLIKSGDTINGVTYAGLNPNLKVHLEFSNEVWGGIGSTTAYNSAAAKQQVAAGNSTLNNDGTTDQGVWAQRYYLQRSMEITNIFRGVFGADPTYAKILPELGWQEDDANYFYTNFVWFEKNYGAPNKFFYGMGDAIYNRPTDYSTVDHLFASLNATLAQASASDQQFVAVANFYGLQADSYEGGPDTGANVQNSNQGQVALAASRDPRMGTFIQNEYDAWFAAGGGLANVYDGPYDEFTPYNQYALAELNQAANPTASPKYAGMVSLSTAVPQAVTGGSSVSATGSTSLSTTSDVLGQPFPGLSANLYLLNVAVAGSYVLSMQTAGNNNGLVTVSTSDATTLGSYTVNAKGTTILTSLSLHAGLNSLQLAASNYFVLKSITLTPASGVVLSDPGFELDAIPGQAPMNYVYDPTGTAWAYSGNAGVSGNGSGFTANDAPAPEGSQVAFLQNTGSISQAVMATTAGNYDVSFLAAQRGFPNAAAQAVQVLVDGVAVGSYMPTGTTYQSIATAPFALTAGTHTITLRGTNGSSDSTALVDSVAIVPYSGTLPTTTGMNDGGFESESVPATAPMNYIYDPTGSVWTYTGYAGVTGNGSNFTFSNANAPQGSQVAFLQNSGAVTQNINGLAAGNYHVGFVAAQRVYSPSVSQTVQVLIDGVLIASLTPSGTAYQAMVTPTFSLTAGAHTLTLRGAVASDYATAFVDAVALVQDANGPLLADQGFESESIPGAAPLNYVYDPTGNSWTYAGHAGVSGNNSGFTSNNPVAPQGTQVAFLQNTGSISQWTTIGTAGNYHVSFLAAQRVFYAAVPQVLQVLVDGVVVGSITPPDSTYQSQATASFALTAGSHTITLRGTTASDNATAFVDNVALTQDATGSAPTVVVTDGGFEADSIPTAAPTNYIYDPSGSAWTFVGESGVSGNGSYFTSSNHNAPEGTQVAFLQNTGSISQTIGPVVAGNYHISFSAAQRSYFVSVPQVVQVLVDGVLVGSFTPAGTTYQSLATASFALTAGSHTITLRGTTASDNATAFVDNVAITQDSGVMIGDAGFESDSIPNTVPTDYIYNPTGTAWTYNGTAGVSGNGSLFTNNNPTAPEGSQVAFLQNTGSISQTVNGFPAGNYTLSLAAAQRAYYATQSFQVLIDGVVVAVFTPATTTYQTLTTAKFALKAGSHTIAFQGLNTTGDATAFLDNVTLTAS